MFFETIIRKTKTNLNFATEKEKHSVSNDGINDDSSIHLEVLADVVVLIFLYIFFLLASTELYGFFTTVSSQVVYFRNPSGGT